MIQILIVVIVAFVLHKVFKATKGIIVAVIFIGLAYALCSHFGVI